MLVEPLLLSQQHPGNQQTVFQPQQERGRPGLNLISLKRMGGRGEQSIDMTYLVDIKHVKIDSSELHNEWMSQGFASANIGFQNTAELFHCFL